MTPPRSMNKKQVKRGSVYGVKNVIGSKKLNESKTFSFCKQRLKYIYDKETDESREINPDLLMYLKGVTWDMHSLTPLTDISYTEIHMKTYAARIKQALARLIQGKEEFLSFKTKITDIDTVLDSENNEYRSLQIEVYQQREKEQLKYKGILLNLCILDGNNFKSTPLLFCIGSISIKNVVHNTLQEIFNTVITPIKIHENDLYWILLLTDLSRRPSKKECHFHYNIPGDRKKKIKLKMSVEIMNDLWKKIIESNNENNEITLEQVETFKVALENETFKCFNFRMNKFNLNTISLPSLTVQTEGKIKFHISEIISVLVRFFQNETYFRLFGKIQSCY